MQRRYSIPRRRCSRGSYLIRKIARHPEYIIFAFACKTPDESYTYHGRVTGTQRYYKECTGPILPFSKRQSQSLPSIAAPNLVGSMSANIPHEAEVLIVGSLGRKTP